MSELRVRKCPCCRGPAAIFRSDDTPFAEKFGVICSNCALKTEGHRTPGEAAMAWNRRDKPAIKGGDG